MHKLEKLVIFFMVPMQAIAVFPFRLMGVGEVHDVLGCRLHLVIQLTINQTLVPLGKEN